MIRLALALALALATIAVSSPAGAVNHCAAEFGANPTAEELYNAGVCYEEARSIGVAIRLFSEVRKRHPRSSLARKSLVRLAHLYRSVAMFDRAARLYLEYARKFGGEKDAPDALREAIALFAGLGDTAQAIRASETFIKNYSRKRSGDAAAVAFSIAGLHERAGDDKAMARQLERYLKTFGTRGGRDRAAIAHARLGLMLWERSCPVRVAPGQLCVRPLPRRRPNRTQSCDPSLSRVRRVARDRALVREAKQHLEKATKLFRQTNKPSARERRAGYWVTRAELALLDEPLEDYIAITFPRGLDFDPKKQWLVDRSKKRFTTWIKSKSAAGAALDNRYKPLLRRPDWRQLTASRMASISLDFRDQLASAEIPKIARTGPYAADTKAAYCGALGDQARPLEQRAIYAYTHCLESGAQSDPWIKRCRAALHRLDPKQFPERLEVRMSSNHLAPVLDRAGRVY